MELYCIAVKGKQQKRIAGEYAIRLNIRNIYDKINTIRIPSCSFKYKCHPTSCDH